MGTEKQEILDVLNSELAFLQSGGYRRSPERPWRAPLVFEDSPTCARFYQEQRDHPCGECLLMAFVPPELREKKVACRYIPLNERGDTLDSLYHSAYEQEIEEEIACWLRTTICLLGKESVSDCSDAT